MQILADPRLDAIADRWKWSLIPYGRAGEILFGWLAWGLAIADVALEMTRNARAAKRAD